MYNMLSVVVFLDTQSWMEKSSSAGDFDKGAAEKYIILQNPPEAYLVSLPAVLDEIEVFTTLEDVIGFTGYRKVRHNLYMCPE